MRWARAISILLLASAMGAAPALAYRPFDSTDAAVAAPGELEIELGPVGYLREGSDKNLVVPAGVLNLGLVRDWEFVLQGRGESALSQSRPFTFGENGVFLKHVLREGSLQDMVGPSIATEFGVLLPGVGTDRGTGASVAGIVSQRLSWMTAHLNVAAALTREQRPDLFVGGIVEGPSTWKVRPVAELFEEREFGRATTLSGLVGAIWQLRDDLSLDFGVRHANVGGRGIDEVRAGLTFSFGVW